MKRWHAPALEEPAFLPIGRVSVFVQLRTDAGWHRAHLTRLPHYYMVGHMALDKKQTAMDRLLAFIRSLIAPFTKGEG